MIIEKLHEESVYLEYAEEVVYFYFAEDVRLNYQIFVSTQPEDHRAAAEYLCLNNVPICCYKIVASRPEWNKLRVEKEIAMKNGIIPFDLPDISSNDGTMHCHDDLWEEEY